MYLVRVRIRARVGIKVRVRVRVRVRRRWVAPRLYRVGGRSRRAQSSTGLLSKWP